MSDRQDDDREYRATTDRDRIREWGRERNAVPAAREAGDAGTEYGFFRQGNVDEEYREYTWDEFLDEFESEDRAFVYHEDETVDDDVGHYEIIDRDEAATRMTVENEEVEDELMSGGTVTTEVTETTVVEREVVETETIESEVVDEEVVRSRVTDAELVDWGVSDPDVDFDLRADEDVAGSTVITTSDGAAQYEDLDLDTTVDGDITAEIDETWRLRREVDERATVESRVVDADVEEHDRVEDETVEASVDTEGVHRSLVEGDVLDADANTTDVVEADVIETERTDEGRFESRLVQRTVYEDRVRRRKRIRFDYAGSDVIDTETLDSDRVESRVVAVDYDEDEEMAATATGVDTDTDTDAVADTDTETYGETTTADAAADDATGEEYRTRITEEDRNKTVVDEDGEAVGRVTRVEGDVAYVEPHAGLLERVESMLGMGDHDEDEYPLDSDQVRRITDDEVVVSDRVEADIGSDADDDRR